MGNRINTRDSMYWLADAQPQAERRQYTESDMRASYSLGIRAGWIGAMGFYALATVVVVLAFRALGVTP